jgi:hypothetical protein
LYLLLYQNCGGRSRVKGNNVSQPTTEYANPLAYPDEE